MLITLYWDLVVYYVTLLTYIGNYHTFISLVHANSKKFIQINKDSDAGPCLERLGWYIREGRALFLAIYKSFIHD